MLKRILSTAIGIIILFFVFLYNNILVINIATTVVALIGLSEFYNAFKSKGYKPIETLGYLATLRHIRNSEYLIQRL